VVVAVVFLALAYFAAPVASSQDIHVLPESESFTAVLSGTEPAAAAGAFTGSLSLNGSSSEIPVAGIAQASGQRLAITIRIKYRDVPEDWANRFRNADFDYRLHGRVAGSQEIEWSGTKRWDQVEVDKGRDTASAAFIKLGSIELTEFSLFESAAKAHVDVQNPLSFPLKLASTNYRLIANGREVGSGSTKGMILQAARKTTLDLPIEVDHGQLLAAAGSVLRSGGEVEARLPGTLVIRLPGGDISVPLDLAGKFSLFK
jgi:LEA14-like dessication related protein